VFKNRFGQFCSEEEDGDEYYEEPEPIRVAIAIQWDGCDQKEIKSFYPFYSFFIGRRSIRKKKELVACVGDRFNDDDWVFKGDWILLLENDEVKILTNVFYRRGLRKGEIILT
jgi:hypothetical protein